MDIQLNHIWQRIVLMENIKRCVSNMGSSSDWIPAPFILSVSVCRRRQGPPVWFTISKFCGKWWTVAKGLRFGELLQF